MSPFITRLVSFNKNNVPEVSIEQGESHVLLALVP